MRYGWKLDQESWRSLKDTISEFEWRRAYLETDYTHRVPQESGVYLICACPKEANIEGGAMDRLYNTIYAGQAKNLRKRFKQHVRGYSHVKQAISTFRRLDFWFIQVSPDLLDRVEQILIDVFGPTANSINVKATIGHGVPAGRPSGGKQ